MQDRYIFGNNTSLKINHNNKLDQITLSITDNNKVVLFDKEEFIVELEELIGYIKKYASKTIKTM